MPNNTPPKSQEHLSLFLTHGKPLLKASNIEFKAVNEWKFTTQTKWEAFITKGRLFEWLVLIFEFSKAPFKRQI